MYNITYYLPFHPGGKSQLMRAAGTDCTLLFNQVILKVYIIGVYKSMPVHIEAKACTLKLRWRPFSIYNETDMAICVHCNH